MSSHKVMNGREVTQTRSLSFLGFAFLILLRSLVGMTSKMKNHLSTLYLHLLVASEKLLDFAIAGHFVESKSQHLLKSFLLMHFLHAAIWRKFIFQHPVTSEKSLDFTIASHFVRLRFQHLLKSFLMMQSLDAPH
jgi:hypothetical protein